jgi:hypothetical protein
VSFFLFVGLGELSRGAPHPWTAEGKTKGWASYREEGEVSAWRARVETREEGGSALWPGRVRGRGPWGPDRDGEALDRRPLRRSLRNKKFLSDKNLLKDRVCVRLTGSRNPEAD